MISVHFWGKPFNITVIQVCAPTSNAEEAEVEQFYEDLKDILELTPKKDVLFIIGDWNAKVGSQEIPGITGKFGLGVKLSRTKANRVLPRNSLVTANTLFQQHKRTLYTWTSPESQHRNQIDFILWSQRWRNYRVSKNKTGSWLWLRSWTPYPKFRLKLKKVGKIIRPLR